MSPEQAKLLPFVQYRCVVGSRAYGLMGLFEGHKTRLGQRFSESAVSNVLPEEPDYQSASEFLVRARRFAVGFEVLG